MSQIAHKVSLILGIIMILLLITIIPQITQKDNSVTLPLIMIMPQIIYKESVSFSFYFLAILLVYASQESCIGTEIWAH